jgi:hypothetical protein
MCVIVNNGMGERTEVKVVLNVCVVNICMGKGNWGERLY